MPQAHLKSASCRMAFIGFSSTLLKGSWSARYRFEVTAQPTVLTTKKSKRPLER